MELVLTILVVVEALAIGYLIKPKAKNKVNELSKDELERIAQRERQYQALFSYNETDAIGGK